MRTTTSTLNSRFSINQHTHTHTHRGNSHKAATVMSQHTPTPPSCRPTHSMCATFINTFIEKISK